MAKRRKMSKMPTCDACGIPTNKRRLRNGYMICRVCLKLSDFKLESAALEWQRIEEEHEQHRRTAS